MRESKEKCWSDYCLLKGCCLLISSSHLQDLEEPENKEEEMWNLRFYKNDIAFMPHGEYLVWQLFDAICCRWLMKD